MTTVARGFAQWPSEVMARPYDETLLAYVGLMERERIEQLTDHMQRVRDACRVNAAFANPKALEAEHAHALSALRLAPGTSQDMTTVEARAFADALLAKVATQTFVEVS